MDGSIPSDLAFDTLDSLRRWLALGVAACLGALAAVAAWMAWSVKRDGRWPPGAKAAQPLDPSRRPLATAGLAAAALVAALAAATVAFSA